MAAGCARVAQPAAAMDTNLVAALVYWLIVGIWASVLAAVMVA